MLALRRLTLVLGASGVLSGACAARNGPALKPRASVAIEIGTLTPAEVFRAMLAPDVAPMPIAAADANTSTLAIAPLPAAVWLSEPVALVNVEARVLSGEATTLLSASSSWSLSTSIYVAARVLGKLPAAVDVSVVAIDGAVVLVPLARYIEANSAAEAIGVMASLLGQATDRARLVLGTLQRDGILAPAAYTIDLSTLPATITAVAVGAGSRWHLGGRSIRVVEVADIYDAYAFATGQSLAPPPPIVGSNEDAVGDAADEMFGALSAIWPNVLRGAHDHDSSMVRSLFANSVAAAKAGQWAQSSGRPQEAVIWWGEALVFARAAMWIADAPSDSDRRLRSEQRAIDVARQAVAAARSTPEARADEAAELATLGALRWGRPPSTYPIVSGPPPATGIAMRFARLRQLGIAPPPVLLRWWWQTIAILGLEPPVDLISTPMLRALHVAASERLYQIAMALDVHIDRQLEALAARTSPAARPLP